MTSLTIMPIAAATTARMLGEEAASFFSHTTFALGMFLFVVYFIIGHIPGR